MAKKFDVPQDFDPASYLRLHQDVADARVDPAEHYAKFGRREGRTYREDHVRAPVEMVTARPHPQNLVDIFAGEWSSAFPAESGLVSAPGHAALFSDPRIDFMAETLGPIEGRSILEIGPLEGAHTTMLHRSGAGSIVSVETNPRAFLKCLCVKEIFGLDRASFKLGDAVALLEEEESRYDLVLATGVLYHMADPLRFLRAVVGRTDRLMLWTHYYDEAIVGRRRDAHFFETPSALDPDRRYRGAKRYYSSLAFDWKGFSGGTEAHAVWMDRPSILAFLEENGFTRIEVAFEEADHPNGPAFAVAAERG